ncbi:olfactory receptor 56A3-like [Canis lupus dingo]|uniref:olfactory receptor 56A3-like n=1 Tax=Canis lupus dingo TaxID=286419 RepID=UPI000DC66F3D|nr:olfactory receptor 56A3-like [Canis lupus dingo]XP_038285523.1 olfactory receptor 56A3-like [Canis lupus familiaris]XP_048954918.1 olfactory receptor 56A3-like [Canis lupus dingo]
MTAHQNGTISVVVSDFLLNCLVRSPSWKFWLSLPLSFLFLLAMGANGVLLVTIQLEASLHEPMYYLLSILSLLDIVLCLTVIPKVLAIFWFDLRSISFSACFIQMYIMNCFLGMESCTFMVMAYDRYVAICHPLRYSSIITDQFVARAAMFILARNALLTMFIPILSAQLHYCGKNIIENCICANLSVSKLSCDNVFLNRIYQLTIAWTLLGSDLVLIFLSYILILRAILRLKAKGAAAKALSTCGSHFILILFFSTILLVFVFTHMAKKKVSPDIPILLNVLHHVIPAALNPIVYGVRTQEIKEGIRKLLRRVVERCK